MRWIFELCWHFSYFAPLTLEPQFTSPWNQFHAWLKIWGWRLIFPFGAQVVMNTSDASINTLISNVQRANCLMMNILEKYKIELKSQSKRNSENQLLSLITFGHIVSYCQTITPIIHWWILLYFGTLELWWVEILRKGIFWAELQCKSIVFLRQKTASEEGVASTIVFSMVNTIWIIFAFTFAVGEWFMDSVPTWIYIQEEWVLCSAQRKHI